MLSRIFKKNRLLIMIVFIFLILQALLAFTRPLVVWDESVYIGMGKYIGSSGRIGLWEEIRPISLPVLLAVIYNLNLPIIIFGKLLIITSSLFVIILTYLITKKIFRKKDAVFSSILMASSPLFIFYSNYILTGNLSTSFMLASIYFLLGNKYFLTGFFSGLSLITRFTQGIALFPIMLFSFILMVCDKKALKSLPLLSIGLGLVLIPFLIFNYYLYCTNQCSFIESSLKPILSSAPHQSNTVHNDFYDYSGYLITMLIMNPLYIFFIPGLILMKSDSRNLKLLLITIIAISFIVYFSTIPNKQMRFMIVFLPYFAILSGYGFNKFLISVPSNSKKIYKSSIVVMVIILFSVSLYMMYESIEKAETQHEQIKLLSLNFTDGTVVTYDPLFAAYNDLLFIPIYGQFNPEYTNITSLISVMKKDSSIRYFTLLLENYYDYKVLGDETSVNYFRNLLEKNGIYFVEERIILKNHYWIFESHN